MGAGVLAGAAMAFHEATSKSLMPAWATVRTSGSVCERLSPITASARRALPWICGTSGLRISTAASIWPERSAVTTAGVPLKGTTCRSAPVRVRNSSAARFWVLPMLMVPRFRVPGLALASASRSPRVRQRALSATTTARSNVPRVDTGMKSRTVSKGRLLNRPALTAVPLDMSSRV